MKKIATRAVMRTVYATVKARRKIRGPLRPSWSAEFETLAFLLHNYGKRSIHLPLAWQRAALTAGVRRTNVVKSMHFEKVSAGGVPAEWFTPPGSPTTDRALLYLHGGGYSIGSIDSHRDLVSRIAIAAGVRALVPDYRLAPEHKVPAQLNDARAVYRWLLDSGVAPKKIVIAGESAGGGLTLSTLLETRDKGEPLPAAAVLLSPWLDLEAESPSMKENAAFDYVSHKVLRAYAQRFVRDDQMRDPLAAPIHARLEGLPPLLVQAGDAETLADDSRRIAKRAESAGVDVTLEMEPDMIHAWHVFASRFSSAQPAIDRVGAFVRAQLT